MNKKLCKTLGLVILLASSLPFSLVFAETVEEVPTGETTISSMADDPLKEYKEKAANQVSSIEEPTREEPESEPKKETETQTTEDTPTTESSTEDTPDNEAKAKRQPRGGGGITPFSTNLIEDPGPSQNIDADFAKLLRTDPTVQNLGTSWTGYNKAKNQLTDDDMAALTGINVQFKSLLSLIGIEYAVNLTSLLCGNNQLSNLDITKNTALTLLHCMNNQLSSLDVTKNTALTTLICPWNQLGSLDVTRNTSLTTLSCIRNQLSSLDVTKNTSLTTLECGSNQLSSLDVTKNTSLTTLRCESNQLSSLDVTKSTGLVTLVCSYNKLSSLDVTKNTGLVTLECNYNKLSSLDVTKNTVLTKLYCQDNKLGGLDVTKNTALIYLDCNYNQLSSLDVTKNIALTDLHCMNNQLNSLYVAGCIALKALDCQNNQLISLDTTGCGVLNQLHCQNNQLNNLDVTESTMLINLDCSDNKLSSLDVSNSTSLDVLRMSNNYVSDLNQILFPNSLRRLAVRRNMISDITPLFGKTNLDYMDADYQKISIPIPEVNSGQTTIDILKTTAQTGLTTTNGNIIPIPTFGYNGDKILMSNVTRPSISDKYINFSYDGTQLTEGASSGTKMFGGTITFFSASDLSHTMVSNKKKVKSGEKVKWTWKIDSISVKKAENVHAKLNLPAGLTIDPSSITKNGASATLADVDGTNNHGDLNDGDRITFTFETTVTGTVDQWLKAEGRLDWEDDTITSPYHNETEGSVQIQDDEQTYTPKDTDDMSIQSVPVYFNHGTNPIMSTAQTYHLHSMNYQSNTKVVTDGFYTRIKDDRAISAGWKLTAKLSDFRDSSNTPMPNGTGTSLKLENMSIERVTDRDTPQETIDPSPTGTDVPSSVQSTETIVAGQPTAKTLVTAQPNQGQDTWQLRMPFDKISLNVPANAGKKGTVYKAKLTWSLDDTP